ncbi:N-acetyltransferase O1 (Establishment of cohesion protein 1) [Yamadazyma tenuis]|uniref:N-acetyltransferase ECO1 n=1 Tax=Candida tenuis (strain ATCC 10573 / BCRC 21748 / CBS 615 / JCM 9827 / NBRC 10315 / NRRL Y-1498 / VKM Y-70) TaxID=590646 RepID=G3BE13_CANTC|nr:uncharacterized protein CANTEDRAFT_99855 [Yamadazyma tenuis ATCC 10573]EGV60431.1 hypothetical protein CANTEDRAFT_99855 [Yamadazyma tenuis ATCC 10573]WEJ94322.1 N-acetyltransferase O1 (Establishment of cohesion protein 1) [Yamadazyma tenuis]
MKFKKSTIKPKNPKAKVQGSLGFKSGESHLNQTKTCPECGMTFYKLVKKDQEIHQQYHKTFVNGVTWQWNIDPKKILGEYTIQTATGLKKKNAKVKVISVDKQSDSQIRRVDDTLKMVNLELNAPSGSDAWKTSKSSLVTPKAFIAVLDSHIIGICTTEAIEDPEKQSRWMILRTQTIVPKQCNRSAKLGVSRIWVAPLWRRYGIASRLLEIVLTNSVYGVKLTRSQVAFSQPSTNGGLLVQKFNGIVHKSGEMILPVYLE